MTDRLRAAATCCDGIAAMPGRRAGRGGQPQDPNEIRVSRTLRVRLTRDQTMLTHAGSGRPVVVFVGCDPLPEACSAAIARVWWAERHRAARCGIGDVAPGSGNPPHYKFKVSAGPGSRVVMRLTSTTPGGEVTLPPSGSPGEALIDDDPELASAVAATLIRAVIDRYGEPEQPSTAGSGS